MERGRRGARALAPRASRGWRSLEHLVVVHDGRVRPSSGVCERSDADAHAGLRQGAGDRREGGARRRAPSCRVARPHRGLDAFDRGRRPGPVVLPACGRCVGCACGFVAATPRQPAGRSPGARICPGDLRSNGHRCRYRSGLDAVRRAGQRCVGGGYAAARSAGANAGQTGVRRDASGHGPGFARRYRAAAAELRTSHERGPRL